MTLAPVPLLEEAGAAAPEQRRPRPRVRTAGFPAMPLDVSEFFAADLTAPQRGVWMALRMHLWFHGKLPRTAKGLAEIGRVHVRTWAAMAEAIAPHFDIDEEGRWRHHDLEAERTAALAGRARRAAANKSNADKRWGRDGAQDGAQDDGAADEGDASGDANGNANGIAGETGDGGGDGSSGPPPAQPRGLDAGGQSDRLTLAQTSEKIEETDGRTDAARAGGAGAGTADGTPEAAAESPASQPGSDGRRAIAAGACDAGGNPDGIAGSDAGGDAGAGAKPADVPAKVGDAEIFRALREGAADKIPAHLLTREGIAPIRVLIDDGCDFARDIAPAFVAGARGLKRPLDSLRAGFLHEMARANRDEARRQADSDSRQTVGAEGSIARVAVGHDTPEWRAWLAHLGKRSLPLTDVKVDGRAVRGWYFESRWPPGASESEPARRVASG